MFTSRVLRMPACTAAAAVVVATLAASPAVAAKPAPAPTGLGASADAHADGSYDIVADWNAVPSATSYRVKLSLGGSTLASTTVTTTAWSTTLTAAPGIATLSVRGVVGKKPGKTATIPVGLVDASPPNGTYTSSWTDSDGHATVTQKSLTDNSPVGGVTRTINWGDGSGPEAWPSGTTIDHTYPLTEMRYVPRVTLEDAAHNVRVVDAEAIVINDDEAPTGTFANQTATAWAAFTQVTVSQSGIHDNWTPGALIARSVNWGDGTTTAWTATGPSTHVYAAAGSYTPVVTLTDEAGNSAPVSTSEVVVKADTVRPTLTVKVPKAKHSVTAWKTVHGKATDAQTGVKDVWLKAVEKRGAAWYGYQATTHTWVKAASKAKAFKKAKPFHRTTNARHRWTAKLAHLKKGTLVLKVRATDHVQNRSATITRKATLTKP